jgi:hypothetical protein
MHFISLWCSTGSPLQHHSPPVIKKEPFRNLSMVVMHISMWLIWIITITRLWVFHTNGKQGNSWESWLSQSIGSEHSRCERNRRVGCEFLSDNLPLGILGLLSRFLPVPGCDAQMLVMLLRCPLFPCPDKLWWDQANQGLAGKTPELSTCPMPMWSFYHLMHLSLMENHCTCYLSNTHTHTLPCFNVCNNDVSIIMAYCVSFVLKRWHPFTLPSDVSAPKRKHTKM